MQMASEGSCCSRHLWLEGTNPAERDVNPELELDWQDQTNRLKDKIHSKFEKKEKKRTVKIQHTLKTRVP